MKTNFTSTCIFQRLKTMLSIILLCFVLLEASAATYYVRSTGNDVNTGTSWAQSFRTVQRALQAATSGDQIWVVAGTYYPDEGPGQINNSRNARFALKNGIALYGGFTGSETLLSQRDWTLNETVLSGDINQSGTLTGNAYTVVYGTDLNQQIILDGFSIVSGYASTSVEGPTTDGAGLYFHNVLCTINNCIFKNNHAVFAGGGLYMRSTSGSIINCIFQNNYGTNGGGIYIRESPDVNIHNSIFRRNSGVTGSGLEVDAGTIAIVVNCEFNQNTGQKGSGISVLVSTLQVVNCTFSGQRNTADQGVFYTDYGAELSIQNCITWNNRHGSVTGNPFYNIGGSTISVSNSLIQTSGGSGNWQFANITNLGGNIDVDPLFVQDVDFDLFPNSNSNLRLSACSPALNVGNNSFNSQSFDLDGNQRVFGGTIDMGAYELQSGTAAFVSCYQDTDMDGYGNPAVSQQFCGTCASGFVNDNTDCNDNNNAVNPGATEICDDLDNNCNGQINEGVGITSWYRDFDGDGFGNPGVVFGVPDGSFFPCSPPLGFVTNNLDCNDNNPLEFPGQIWYADLDNDGYSTGSTLAQCLRPAGFKATSELTAISGDCDDNNPDINPATIWYPDADTDGYYTGTGITQCLSPGPDYTYTGLTGGGDCDDTNADINPATIWYLDADNDGYYTGTGITQCLSPGPDYKYTGLIGGGDCDDSYADINPGAAEVCNGIDDDCNSMTDDGITFVNYYVDADGDGYGDPNVSQNTCDGVPEGYVTNNNDCDDTNPDINPVTIWYLDADNDGYYTSTGITQCLSPGLGYKYTGLIGGGDCNDSNADINPGATEICNGIDDDCNTLTDDGIAFVTYFADADGDGYGDPNVSQSTCDGVSEGYVTNNNDCDDTNPYINPATFWYLDADNDGYYTGTGITQCLSPGPDYKYTGLIGGGDCDDSNTDINPGATEICNGIDDDCNTLTDDEISFVTYYADADGDGYGNANVAESTCDGAPEGYVTDNNDCDDSNPNINPATIWYQDADNDGYFPGTGITQCLSPGSDYKFTGLIGGGDCDDSNADINPAAIEICDGIDNNCNSQIDEGVLTTYYADVDGDGFGDPMNSIQACSLPAGYVANNTDCDDNDALERPGQVWYKDTDNDGYAQTGAATITQCLRPVGYKVASELTSTTGDCNDNNAAINPAAIEICDGIDNNCNSQIDEGVLATYYADIDGDGFGDPVNSIQACSLPAGYVANNTDCDDNDALERPGQVWYKDTDNDGYAQTGAATITQCLRPVGYKVAPELTSTTGDCNDNNAAINPAAIEICDGIDNNCNSQIDEGVLATYYADIDGDGFGDPMNSIQACSLPAGYVANNTDCDDNDALERPGQVWYKDTDNDGYAQTGTATITQCLRPVGYKVASELTSTTGDCNDNNAAINPAAIEICDGIDNNCNSQIDEGVLATYYADIDGDGFGDPMNSIQACSLPAGYVANNTDCDDNDALERPGQVWYKDTDNDGYAQTGAATITQCLRPVGYKVPSELTSTTGDCNDNNAAINPAATEICDGIDNNCNAQIDEGVLSTYHADIDGDGFGDPMNSIQACSLPAGYVANNTDCDDNDALERPGQVWHKDTDNDGYAQTGAATITQCLRPVGYKVASELTSTTGDCNDNNAAINPAATEICDGIDNNCNAQIDEGVLTTYYADIDGDGFGDPMNSIQACSLPAGYVANNTDCDDNDALERPGQVWYKDTDNDGYVQTGAATITQCLRPVGYKVPSELTSTTGDCNDNNAAINSGAEEVCNGLDDDCNGIVDDLGGSTQGNWLNDDIGNANGSSEYPPCEAGPQDTFYIQSSGFGQPNNDTRHMVFQTLCGDMSIIARVLKIDAGGWAGISMQESLSPGSKKAALKTQLSNFIFREIRLSTGANQNLQMLNRPQHMWLKLVRIGNTFTGYTSNNGINWSFAFSASIPMNTCIHIGLLTESNNNSNETSVEIDQVNISGNQNQARPGENPFQVNEQLIKANLDVEAYPNPVNGYLHVRLDHSESIAANIQVLGLLGELLKETKVDDIRASDCGIDMTELPAGIYLLRVTSSANEMITKRIIKQ